MLTDDRKMGPGHTAIKVAWQSCFWSRDGAAKPMTYFDFRQYIIDETYRRRE